MAPEIQFRSRYSAKVDLWSLGVVLYELMAGKTPFRAAKTPFELSQELISRGSQPFSLPDDIPASPELRHLVSALLTIDQEKRIDLTQFLNHPFVVAARAYSDESSEALISLQRDRRFSFLVAEGSVDDRKAEQLLCDALESADVIIAHLSNAQLIGDFLVFELLTMVCEFIGDFLAEYRCTVQNVKSKIQNSAIEMLGNCSREAAAYTQLQLKQMEVGAFQYLFDKGLEYARDGGGAERIGDDFASVKYHRALAMLRPIAYSKGPDDFTRAVRELFVQISKRYEVVNEARLRALPPVTTQREQRHSLGKSVVAASGSGKW